MECIQCGGELQYIEEVIGSFVYPIDEDGSYHDNDRNFYGDTIEQVECSSCCYSYEFEIVEDCKVKLLNFIEGKEEEIYER